MKARAFVFSTVSALALISIGAPAWALQSDTCRVTIDTKDSSGDIISTQTTDYEIGQRVTVWNPTFAKGCYETVPGCLPVSCTQDVLACTTTIQNGGTDSVATWEDMNTNQYVYGDPEYPKDCPPNSISGSSSSSSSSSSGGSTTMGGSGPCQADWQTFTPNIGIYTACIGGGKQVVTQGTAVNARAPYDSESAGHMLGDPVTYVLQYPAGWCPTSYPYKNGTGTSLNPTYKSYAAFVTMEVFTQSNTYSDTSKTVLCGVNTF